MLATVFEIFTNHTDPLVAEPGPLDILCGKDKTYAKHAGNQVYRELIAAKCEMYSQATSKHAKMKVTKGIVGTMQQQHGSRFLRSTPTGWVEISDCAARDKTSHALRFCAKHAAVRRVATDDEAQKQLSDNIFVRQIEILHKTMQEEDAALDTAVLTPLNDDDGQRYDEYGKTTFDTLRSEDLHAILDESLQENEWDAVMTLAV